MATLGSTMWPAMSWQSVVLILGIVYAIVIVVCALSVVGIVERKLKEKRLT